MLESLKIADVSWNYTVGTVVGPLSSTSTDSAFWGKFKDGNFTFKYIRLFFLFLKFLGATTSNIILQFSLPYRCFWPIFSN